MMVEAHKNILVVRQVCGDIVIGKLNLSVLYVLGVNKFDLFDEIALPKDHCTNKSIKVTTRYKSFLIAHIAPVLHFSGCMINVSNNNYITILFA